MSDNNPLSLSPDGIFNERYRIVRCLAAGGMGAVYEVVHLDTQRHRALKVMLPQLVVNEQLRRRFKQEATVVANVHSQHVIEITDAGVDPATGAPFIVMELLLGQDLKELLKDKGPLKAAVLAEILRQAGMALDRTHEQSIIHRDLKPENLFVTKRDDGSPHVKVLDFGIAKVIQESVAATNQTATIGTPLYMAPEQIKDKQLIGPATDVYALAQVAYTMLVGEAYFAEDLKESENTFQLILTISEGPTESAQARAKRRCNVDLSEAVSAWFSRATVPDPAQRYATAGELAAAFKEAIGGTGDFRMSLPDAGAAAGAVPPGAAAGPDADLATGDFLACQPTAPSEQSAERAGGLVPGGPPPDPARRTELASPAELPPQISQPAATTNTAAVVTPPAGPYSPPARRVLLLGAAAVLVIIGGGLTLWQTVLAPDTAPPAGEAETGEPPAQTAETKPAASATVSAPSAAAAGAGCPAGMVLIDGATFQMGGQGGDEDGPVHGVTLSSYCLDRHEVTAADYGRCVAAGKCVERTTIAWQDVREADRKRLDPLCSYGQAGRESHPISCVDWHDAGAFCSFAGKRLPTEAEWELGARGTDGRVLPWGNEPPTKDLVNGCGRECRDHFAKGSASWNVLYEDADPYPATAPVDSLTSGQSPYGLLHMAGNVEEWTADWLTPYEGSTEPVRDPRSAVKPADSPRIAVRGGSFFAYSTTALAASHRVGREPERRSVSTGFRCAKSLAAKPQQP